MQAGGLEAERRVAERRAEAAEAARRQADRRAAARERMAAGQARVCARVTQHCRRLLRKSMS